MEKEYPVVTIKDRTRNRRYNEVCTLVMAGRLNSPNCLSEFLLNLRSSASNPVIRATSEKDVFRSKAITSVYSSLMSTNLVLTKPSLFVTLSWPLSRDREESPPNNHQQHV